jgi:CHAT domain-containing protein/tetratricopeptide (TPR) repeat protein
MIATPRRWCKRELPPTTSLNAMCRRWTSQRVAYGLLVGFLIVPQIVAQEGATPNDGMSKLLNRAGEAMKRGAVDSALALYREALNSEHQAMSRGMESAITDSIGVAFERLARPDSALRYYRQALRVQREVGDRAGEAATLNNTAGAFGKLGQPDSALAYYFEAVSILREVGDRGGEASAENGLGRVYSNLGRPDSAFVHLRRALLIWRKVGNRAGEGRTLNNIGVVYARQGHLDSALVYYREALGLARQIGDRAVAALPLNNLGNAYADQGRFDSALVFYREAASLARELGDRAAEGRTLGNIGTIQAQNLGHLDSALIYYQKALQIARDIGDRANQGIWLGAKGEINGLLGRPDSALVYYRDALAIAREVGDRASEGAWNYATGDVYSLLGRPDSALAYNRQAVAIAREVGNRQDESGARNNMGQDYADLGRLDSALAYYRQALDIERDVGDRRKEGRTLHGVGAVYAGQGNVDSAFLYYGQALAVEREVGDREGQAYTLSALGEVYSSLGRRDSALAFYGRALGMAREIKALAGEAFVLYKIGTEYHGSRLRDLEKATAYYDSAAVASASVGLHAGGERNRVSLGEKDFPLFERWTLAWVARAPEIGEGRAALAGLAASERGRAQALLALLRRNQTSSPASDLVAEGAQLLTSADRGRAAVLSYLLTAETLLIWIALPTKELSVMQAAVNRDSLALLVAEWRAGLGADEAVSGGRLLATRGSPRLEQAMVPKDLVRSGIRSRTRAAAAATLSKLLLPPKFTLTAKGIRELIIVPHGPLALVPFAALPFDTTGTLLGERFAIRYAPSLASLAEVQQRPRRSLTPAELRKSLVVGNPNMPAVTTAEGARLTLDSLPGSATEGRWVANYVGSPFLTGGEATQVAVETQLPNAPLVHLATHGFAYGSESMARHSFVALGPGGGKDGLLTVGDVLDNPALSLSAELVVLSACQTGLGDIRKAEGTVGLQRAFFARGARSALVSLWSVSDTATTLLMQSFYTHWLGDRDHPTKAEALRRAEGDVRTQPGFEAPIYWAGFQLVGAE